MELKADAAVFAGGQRVQLREPQGQSAIAMVVRFVGNRAAKEGRDRDRDPDANRIEAAKKSTPRISAEPLELLGVPAQVSASMTRDARPRC